MHFVQWPVDRGRRTKRPHLLAYPHELHQDITDIVDEIIVNHGYQLLRIWIIIGGQGLYKLAPDYLIIYFEIVDA